ncbi:methyl-accepting chemotaxis protein [Leisingera sp. S132]|nr:methyl-accepting chemotaxis protein [Leisingera sp. S132]UWQ79928.1 methyl-accepting chemotaxis protein [Leisingera sp. S132]
MLQTFKLSHKLPLLVVGTAVTVTVVLISFSTSYFQRSVVQNAEVVLQSLVRDRETALNNYLESIEAAILTVSAVPSTAKAMKDMGVTWGSRSGGGQEEVGNLSMFASASSPYDIHFERNHPAFAGIMERLGYYDIFLINPEGDVIFSVTKEADYATNLKSGPYNETGLAKAFQLAAEGEKENVYFSDIAPYAPSANAPGAFAATRIQDSGGRFIGVFAVQVAIDEISEIVTEFGGELETLDVYLAGQDFKARTASRQDGGHGILGDLGQRPHLLEAFTASSVTAGTGDAAAGGRFYPSTALADGSTGAAVSTPVTFRNLRWALIAELDRDEILAPAAAQQKIMILISLICAALVSIFGWLFARSVTRPIDRICADMEAVSSGDLDTEVAAASRGDEIGKIGKTLVSMQDDLKLARAAEEERAEMQRLQQQVVEKLSSGLVQLADGDFSQPITSAFPEEYEQLRQNFNSTVSNLSTTVQQVIEASGSIRNGAAEISQASDDLSHRTESQAATLEQTAAALDELTASVKSAADGARSVEATMAEARTEAENNREVVQSAVSAMTEIEQSSNHISQIISVIDDIAFQTNLLALNAGVEAARAGEAGKGFAVVASEVRALAQRSSDAAMEIKTLISDSSKQVERGVDLVGKAGEALQSIVEQVTHISQLVSGIAEGAAEQSTGLNEINTGVTQLDQVTQQNAAMVEEATAAGHMLNTDAGKLAELVAHFRVSGGAAPARPAPAAAPAAKPAKPAPSAHGEDDWQIEASPAPAAAASSGNAARDLWQDF